MSDEVQLSEPAAELLAVAERVTAPWLRRAAQAAAGPHGLDPTTWDDLDSEVDAVSSALLLRLATLLAIDVDEQRTNPLSLYRAAAVEFTDLLRRHEVPVPPQDTFADEHFPDDPYRLGPAAWNDVDEGLHVPGLTWGAWKAMTVLQRRREEGRR